MLIINYFTIIFLFVNLINVSSINLPIYAKIIKWYEQTYNYNSSWFDNGIYFDSYITPESSIIFVSQINQLIHNNTTDIFIILDTDGGDLLMTHKIISHMDFIRNNYRIKFHCINIKAYSSGFFIFQLCDYRYWINETSKLMIHEPKLNIQGTFEYVKTYIENDFTLDYKNYQLILNKIYSKSNINANFYQNKIANKDWVIFLESDVRLLNLADFYFINI